MLLTSPERLGFVIDAVAGSQALSPEQIQQLKDLRDGDPALLAITDPLALVEALCKPYLVSVSLPPIARVEWPRDELYNALLQMTLPNGVPFFLALDAMKGSANQEAAALAKMVELTLNGPLAAISLENPGVAQGLAGLKQAGLLTQEQYDYITTLPNPVTTELMPSKIDQTLGVSNGVLTLEEAAQVIG